MNTKSHEYHNFKIIIMSKKLIFSLLLLLTLTLAQQVQAQETKQYATVFINYHGKAAGYSVVYPDGSTNGDFFLKDRSLYPEEVNKVVNELFNKISKMGYKLVSSNGGDSHSTYIFEK